MNTEKYGHHRIAAHPEKTSALAQCDEIVCEAIPKTWNENHGLCGARKMWLMLKREGIAVPVYTVERLMKRVGFQRAMRSKKVMTTCQSKAQPCPYADEMSVSKDTERTK
jgi:putative transposase